MALTEAEQNRLIMAHTELIDRVAPNFRGRKGIPYEEICAEGMAALVESARKYLGTNGAAFSTYATPRIRGAIINYIDRWRATVPLDGENDVESRVFEPHAAWSDVPATPEQIRLLFEETAHRTAAVEAALIGLSPKERRMVEAHFLDTPKIGLAQIARDNGCSYYIAVNTIYRAVKKMRETIDRIGKNQSDSPGRKGRPGARVGVSPTNIIPFVTQKRAARKSVAP
jgi:RNA polymerase sigma factor (sigma-70 family)